MRKSAAALVLMLLAGCQSQPRYAIAPSAPIPAPPQEQQQTARPLKPPRPVPNYSGTAGPLTAAGIGRYMDAMESDLRHILKGTAVARPGDALSLNLRDDALFEKDGGLTDDGRDLLRALSVALRHYDHTTVQINGYTDTRGTPDKSLALSQKRADAVAAGLRGDGVAGARLSATGYGQTHLKIATGAGKGEPRNRRIEIRILPRPG